ncbi:MAG: esterase-like activity of phytase family protein, partial [Gammaproteobacteria bacterium]
PAHGLVLAPERPLRDSATSTVTLYGAGERRWELAAFDRDHGTVVSLETMPDGALLLLERRFVNLFFPIRFRLSRVELSPDGGAARVQPLGVLDNTAGWALDNFEGVAHHVGDRYFMVSDDNRHPLQHTLLVYFALAALATAP